MKTVNEPLRAVDVVLETDVLVVGSGPGGLAAALAAARAGARTALIDRNGEWNIETSGKEDNLFSPFLRKPFKQAVAAGVIPANLTTIAGTWGTVSDQGGRFADSIGIFPEFIDGYGILIIPTTGRYFHVPLSSLVPKGIVNLLVAGRSIGGDRVSHAAVRNMMCCAVSGQGAGVAAAISLRTGEPFDRLDIGAVQTELRRQGARIQ